MSSRTAGPETDVLLEGLEILAKAQLEYQGVLLPELDIDAALQRKAEIVLVDELAHTNVPGSRHEKRWQDIEELLAAGIDVYTTVNVQHFESVKDIVAQITGVTVQETVPDSMLDQAAEITLVDIPPEELLQRLRQGKVYIPEQAAWAAAEILPARQPHRPARTGPAPGGGQGRRRDADLYGDPRHPRSLAGDRTAPGLRQRQPVQRKADPHHPPAGGRTEGRVVYGVHRDPEPWPGSSRKTGNGSGATCVWPKASGPRW